jgi:hypothetical protein
MRCEMNFEALTKACSRAIDWRGVLGRLVADLAVAGLAGAGETGLAKKRDNRPKHKDC